MTNEEKTGAPSAAGKMNIITMSFTGEEISFRAAGSGTAVIDWGDGVREEITLKEGSLDLLEKENGFEAKHFYKKPETAALVIIEGNVTSFFCGRAGSGALDVRRNPALGELNCSGSGITSLDLRDNPALRVLICRQTRITTLDVSKNTALLRLDCSRSGITSLDLRENNALMSLYCDESAVTSLDVSNNTALFDLNVVNTKMTSAAAEALFKNLPVNRDKSRLAFIVCGGTTACGEEEHAAARAKNWELIHF